MTLAESLLPEFDHEMGVTRRLLERVPDGQLSWAPHEKSMTLGRLAQHLSELPRWCSATITQSGVYLRLQNVLIPSMYGPSADEPM